MNAWRYERRETETNGYCNKFTNETSWWSISNVPWTSFWNSCLFSIKFILFTLSDLLMYNQYINLFNLIWINLSRGPKLLINCSCILYILQKYSHNLPYSPYIHQRQWWGGEERHAKHQPQDPPNKNSELDKYAKY